MNWRNTAENFGLIAIALHWIVALVVIGLFALGLWMTELNYYDPWYTRAPEMHKGVGVLLFFLVLARLLWRSLNQHPKPLGTALENKLAGTAHGLLYLLLVASMISGYLISTADGRPLGVFDWFALPATLSGLKNQEDIAGEIHELLAYILIGLSLLHTLAALKHHYIDRNRTLRRMLNPNPPNT